MIGSQLSAIAQDDENDISLLVYATQSAIAGMNGPDAAAAAIKQSIKNLNDALSRSGVDREVALTGLFKADNSLNICKRTLLQELTSEGALPEFNENRDMYRADVVAVIIDDAQSCGASGYSNSRFAAFMVLHYGCLGDNYSLSRQMAYLLSAGNLNDQSGIFSFFAPNGRAHTGMNDNGDATFTTILGYTDDALSSKEDDFIMVPYFSNPNVSYRGATTGTATANNAKAISDQWKYVSNYNENYNSYAIYEAALDDDEELYLECEETLLFEDYEARSGSEMTIKSPRVVFKSGVKFVRGSNAYMRRRIE